MSPDTETRPADFAIARFNMVESQIRPNKVRHLKLLDALSDVPREMFVPTPLASIAYLDEDLQVAPKRYLLEPMVLARLIESADVKPSDRVLDVAPATGYSTAVLAALAKSVTGLEDDAALSKVAANNLAALNIRNAEMVTGPLAEGARTKAPFDLIVINGSAEFVPDALAQQLADGGRLVVVIKSFGPAYAAHQGEARLYEKIHGALSHRALFDANVKALAGFEAKRGFAF